MLEKRSEREIESDFKSIDIGTRFPLWYRDIENCTWILTTSKVLAERRHSLPRNF